MPVRVMLDLDDDLASALDRARGEIDPECGLGLAATELLRDWLIAHGYLPADEIEEDTPTVGEA